MEQKPSPLWIERGNYNGWNYEIKNDGRWCWNAQSPEGHVLESGQTFDDVIQCFDNLTRTLDIVTGKEVT